MRPLSPANVESELSYAYLHAVASAAGASCSVTGRHEDNTGVDARLVAWGPFPGGGYLNEVDLKVQLKATVTVPAKVADCWSYSLDGISHYDDLRTEAIALPRILVVLFLPKECGEWISHTDEALTLHKCAYWVSLRGAEVSANKAAQTVYIPSNQRFDIDGLKALFAQLSRKEAPVYRAPKL